MKAKQEQLPVVVVDLGFSAAKYKYGNTLRRKVSAFLPHGETFIVGDAALLKSSNAGHLKTPDELIKRYPLFVNDILAELKVKSPVTLAVGLPYKFWKDAQNEEKMEAGAVQQLIKRLTTGHVQSVQVLPQGLGGVVCHLSSRNSEPTGNLLAIDFGFNTIIVTLYSPAKEQIIWDHTYYVRGAHQMVMAYLCPMIEHHLPAGRPSNPLHYMQYLEMGYVQHGFKQIDIKDEIARAAKKYIDDTVEEIGNDLRVHAGVTATFTEVLFFGGGARFLPEPKDEGYKMHVLPEPEFANAKGFEILARKEG